MRGVNKVILIGNCGKDPDTRYLPSGAPVANISIATSERWKDKTSGEEREKTEWHNLIFFNKLAEIAGQYLKKGSPIYVEGKLQTRKWEKEGQTHYTTEIVVHELQMLGSKPAAEGGAPATGARQQQARAAPATATAGGDKSFEDDDIPF